VTRCTGWNDTRGKPKMISNCTTGEGTSIPILTLSVLWIPTVWDRVLEGAPPWDQPFFLENHH